MCFLAIFPVFPVPWGPYTPPPPARGLGKTTQHVTPTLTSTRRVGLFVDVQVHPSTWCLWQGAVLKVGVGSIVRCVVWVRFTRSGSSFLVNRHIGVSYWRGVSCRHLSELGLQDISLVDPSMSWDSFRSHDMDMVM